MYKIIAISALISFNCFADKDPICTAESDCACKCVKNPPYICLCSTPCKPEILQSKPKILEISAKIDKQNNKIDFSLP